MARVQKAWSIDKIWRDHESAFVLLLPVVGREGEPDDDIKQLLESTGLSIESCMNWEEDVKRPWRLLMFGGVQFFGVMQGSTYNDELPAFAPGLDCVRKPKKALFRAAFEDVMVDDILKKAIKTVHVVGLDSCAEILFIGNEVDQTLATRDAPTPELVAKMAEKAFPPLPVAKPPKAASKKAPAKKAPAKKAPAKKAPVKKAPVKKAR